MALAGSLKNTKAKAARDFLKGALLRESPRIDLVDVVLGVKQQSKGEGVMTVEDRLNEIMALDRKEREFALLEFAKELGCAPMRIYGEKGDLWKDGEGELLREDTVIRRIREAAKGDREAASGEQARKWWRWGRS